MKLEGKQDGVGRSQPEISPLQTSGRRLGSQRVQADRSADTPPSLDSSGLISGPLQPPRPTRPYLDERNGKKWWKVGDL